LPLADLFFWGTDKAHPEDITTAIYVGTNMALDESITHLALAYADQTKRDHEALIRAARQGRIQVAGAELIHCRQRTAVADDQGGGTDLRQGAGSSNANFGMLAPRKVRNLGS
jgi:hypothetical protein